VSGGCHFLVKEMSARKEQGKEHLNHQNLNRTAFCPTLYSVTAAGIVLSGSEPLARVGNLVAKWVDCECKRDVTPVDKISP